MSLNLIPFFRSLDQAPAAVFFGRYPIETSRHFLPFEFQVQNDRISKIPGGNFIRGGEKTEEGLFRNLFFSSCQTVLFQILLKRPGFGIFCILITSETAYKDY